MRPEKIICCNTRTAKIPRNEINPQDISVKIVVGSILGMMVSQTIHSISYGIPQTEASKQPVIRVTAVVVHCAAVTTVVVAASAHVCGMYTLVGRAVVGGDSARRHGGDGARRASRGRVCRNASRNVEAR